MAHSLVYQAFVFDLYTFFFKVAIFCGNVFTAATVMISLRSDTHLSITSTLMSPLLRVEYNRSIFLLLERFCSYKFFFYLSYEYLCFSDGAKISLSVLDSGRVLVMGAVLTLMFRAKQQWSDKDVNGKTVKECISLIKSVLHKA